MIVMLHGWALHGGVFASLVDALGCQEEVLCPDLPGHGSNPFPLTGHGLDDFATAVADSLPPRCTLLGWSLGGMIALRLAAQQHPAIERLALIGATPRFVSGSGWEAGLDPRLVTEFASELQQDYRRLVLRFLALQTRGEAQQASLLRELRALVFDRGEPDPRGLAAGLQVLLTADLREESATVQIPTLVLAGERDRLTPPAAGTWLAARMPQAKLEILPGSGHAPFLAQPQTVAASLLRFCRGEARGQACA